MLTLPQFREQGLQVKFNRVANAHGNLPYRYSCQNMFGGRSSLYDLVY